MLNDCLGLARIMHQQNRAHLRLLTLFHQPEDNGILDRWVRTQDVFDVLRIHLHAIGEHDHVLLTPLQAEIVAAIQITEVTCVIPAILKGGGSGLGILPVPQRDVWPMYQNLIVLSDAHLYPGEGFADRVKNMILVGSDRDNWCALGRPIALHDAEAHVLPAFRQARQQIRSPADEETEMPAKTLVDRAKQVASPCEWQTRSDPLEHLPLLLALLSPHFGFNAVQEKLQNL